MCIGSPLCGAINYFYEGTPENVTGSLDFDIWPAIDVSYSVTLSEPKAALSHVIKLSVVISANAINELESASASPTEP